MKYEDIMMRLREPFAFKDVEWKIQITTQDKTRGMAVAYINSRAIQNRLDEVIGAFNWKNSFAAWQDNAQICGLSVYDSERGDWVTKYDGAENTDRTYQGRFKRFLQACRLFVGYRAIFV